MSPRCSIVRYEMQRRGREHDADEEVRAERGGQEVRILADPAEPRPRGEIALEHGARIDRRPARHVAARRRADELTERDQAGTHHVVVVAPPRVAGDGPPAVVGGFTVVAHRDRHHRAAARQEPGGIEPVGAAELEVAHRAGIAGVQPRLELGGVLGGRGRTDRDPIEAELERPRLHGLTEGEADQGHALRAFTTSWARVSVRPPSSRNFT